MVDVEKVVAELKQYKPIIEIYPNDTMEQEINANYNQIKADVENIILSEMERVTNDPRYEHLVKKR